MKFIPLRVAALYAVFAILWITASDQAVEFLFPTQVTLVQTFKGWFFVVITTVLLFLVLSAELRRRYSVEAELRKSEERFRIIADTSPVAIFIIRYGDGEIRFCNTAAGELLASDPSKIIGRFFGEFEIEPKDGESFPRISENAGRLRDFEGSIQRSNGTTRSILASLQHMELDGERVILTAAVDITERNTAEDALLDLQAQLAHVSRLSAMGEMAAEFAHELNQPLTAISNYANGSLRLIRTDRMDAPKIEEAFQFVLDQAHRAGEVIRRIRQFARKEIPEKKATNINLAISEATDLLRADATHKGVNIILDLAKSPPQIPADAIQIQQVILNLARNAIEAMSEKGEPRRLKIKTRVNDDESGLEVTVSDTGLGMTPEVLESLFNPFFSTKPNGLGIGLGVCRTIVRAHGGEITVSSDQESGTTFRFTLPFEEALQPVAD